jgi:hypothetical protein
MSDRQSPLVSDPGPTCGTPQALAARRRPDDPAATRHSLPDDDVPPHRYRAVVGREQLR